MMNSKITSAALVTVLGTSILIAGTTPAEATTIQSRALSVAAAQKGDPYRYGAAGPNAFDCSGLTKYSYAKAGRTLPRTAQSQYNKSTHVSWSHRHLGDLVFIGTSRSRITHVGIYAGHGQIWNANTGSYRGRRVVKAPISEYLGGGRHYYLGHVK